MRAIAQQWADLPVINAAGYSTRVGGSCPDAVVLEAMAWAQQHYFEIDDLLGHASAIIASVTGAEAGLVTCGASAALTLGAAALLAKDRVEVMEMLPEVRGLERFELVYPLRQRYDYDHPLRAAGALLVEVDFDALDWRERLEKAVGERTAGVVYVWKRLEDSEKVAEVAAVCRTLDVPLLLDAAMALPPVGNLKDWSRCGADLIALSGGKHLGGPQNSGLLFGREKWVASAWMQMVDMDVRPETWSFREWFGEHAPLQPPRHGIGRGMKVGKEVIAGCMSALLRYETRDFEAERREWIARCQTIAEGLQPPSTFLVHFQVASPTGQYPVVRLEAATPLLMNDFKQRLKTGSPKIIVTEDEERGAVVWLYPMGLRTEELPTLLERLQHAFPK